MLGTPHSCSIRQTLDGFACGTDAVNGERFLFLGHFSYYIIFLEENNPLHHFCCQTERMLARELAVAQLKARPGRWLQVGAAPRLLCCREWAEVTLQPRGLCSTAQPEGQDGHAV